MDNSSDGISIESDPSKGSNPGLKYVTHWPPVNIEFQDLVYSVPDMQGKGRRCYSITAQLVAYTAECVVIVAGCMCKQ